MVILSYTNDDLVMTVSCNTIGRVYKKAAAKIRSISDATAYTIIDDTDAGQLALWFPEGEDLQQTDQQIRVHPVFFENTSYRFDINFIHPVERPLLYSRLLEVEEEGTFREGKQEFVVGLNFGNDIGVSEFKLLYVQEGVQREMVLQFEVFPVKLDLRQDHQLLVQEVESVYSRLALDLLKRTFLQAHPVMGQGDHLTWWIIFDAVFRDLVAAMRFVLNKPHSRLVNTVIFCRREQLKVLTPRLEEELFLHRDDPGRLYKVNSKTLSSNTVENRWLKHVALYTAQKFSYTWQYIRTQKGAVVSKKLYADLASTGQALQRIAAHPFLKATGDFTGIAQESAVLQKKAGYSAIYKSWIFLKRSIQLFEGVQKVELKPISELYQIWCFLQMKQLLQKLTGSAPIHADMSSVQYDGLLSSFKRGVSSCVVFTSQQGDRVELYHDLTYDRKGAFRVFTDEQRPDISLRVIKNDPAGARTLTYLFDAKYQVGSARDEEGCDSPPVDAIGQMHRYRDAIYYVDPVSGERSRAVKGGYILFPGAGETESIKKSRYFQSIGTIDMGGLPLMPGDRYGSNGLLEALLRGILGGEGFDVV